MYKKKAREQVFKRKTTHRMGPLDAGLQPGLPAHCLNTGAAALQHFSNMWDDNNSCAVLTHQYWKHLPCNLIHVLGVNTAASPKNPSSLCIDKVMETRKTHVWVATERKCRAEEEVQKTVSVLQHKDDRWGQTTHLVARYREGGQSMWLWQHIYFRKTLRTETDNNI